MDPTKLVEQMPPAAQLLLLLLTNVMSGLVGNAAARRKDAQTHSWIALVESQGKGLEDMQERIDVLQRAVAECERTRVQDRRQHEADLRVLSERHSREVGELQGQITTLRHMLRGD